jgi:DNA polymerase III epsilon subunit-like protein
MKTLIFDTETTGLIDNILIPMSRQPRIIEFTGILFNDGIEDSIYSTLFDPDEHITPEITRITGIRNEDLKGKPRFQDKFDQIASLIENSDEVVAHNLSFDKQMIDFEMLRCQTTVEWPRVICTVESTEHVKGYRLKLGELHEFLFGETFRDAHRGETDTRALARCFFELRNRGSV